MDESTRLQLELIGELSRLFPLDLQWWLFGGWAIDFHAGKITRDHADIEVFVCSDEAQRVRALLRAAGFSDPPPLHPAEGQPYLRDGIEVGVWYVSSTEPRRMLGRMAEWSLPSGSFEKQRQQIGAIEAPAVSLECLLELKTGFSSHEYGAPPRRKDLQDIQLIRALMDRR